MIPSAHSSETKPECPDLGARDVAGSGSAAATGSLESVRAAVENVVDLETGLPLAELGMVGEVALEGSIARIRVMLAPGQFRSADELSEAVAEAAGGVSGVESVEVRIEAMSAEEEKAASAVLRARQRPDPPFFGDGRTRVLLVASGKGGVGKSTVAVNLACEYANAGKQVGLLDADVWGYSVPSMLGTTGDPVGIGDLLLPERVAGVKAVSVGFLADPGSPVIWRGPMLHEAISQFLGGVYWGELDVLVVDLPPGTGDVPMSLAALVPDASVVVVTTPQEAASRVAELAGRMAAKAKLRIAGVVENMAGFVCPHCGERSEIFGDSGGQALADRLGVSLLGRVPIAASLRQGGDAGRPIVLERPTDPAAKALMDIAAELERQAPPRARKLIPVAVADLSVHEVPTRR